MTWKVIIFEAGDIAQLAHCYFENDGEYGLVAFTAAFGGGRHE
jgi:hypothetical protein